MFGGAKGDRTPDLLHAMQALSQLSYGPMGLGRIDPPWFRRVEEDTPTLDHRQGIWRLRSFGWSGGSDISLGYGLLWPQETVRDH